MKSRHLVLGGAALLTRPLWAQDAPETPAATPVSLYDPTRYVFAADEGVAQVLFFESDEICETSYKDRNGKYMGQTGVTLPKT